ncbi:MAG: DUF2062 domain-containing protein [Alphaproteobacteria bacterium]|nr:DUF2062 domain-containing protein [Alphaproteobacteria bacterium]
MLGRRKKQSFLIKTRRFLLPSSLRNLKRNFMYHWHLLNRVKGSTRQIAMGCAIGAAISMTPLIGTHIILGGILALITRSSIVAMTIASVIFGNPWTFPFIFWVNYRIGSLFVDVKDLSQDETGLLNYISDLLRNGYYLMLNKVPVIDFLVTLRDFIIYLFPFLIGSIPLAIFVFLVVFYATEEAIVVYHDNKLKRKRIEHKKKIQND